MDKEIETPDWLFVREAIASPGLLSLRLKWSWRHFTWVYVFRIKNMWHLQMAKKIYEMRYDPY